jgi:hypothetical protein
VVWQAFTLWALMALIRQCSLFITNDSADILAAALESPNRHFGSTSELPLVRSMPRPRSSNPVPATLLQEVPHGLCCMTGIS